MKYKEAMQTPDRKGWIKAAQEEYERFLKHDVFDVVKCRDLPKGTRTIDSTWAMKKKSNGILWARLNV